MGIKLKDWKIVPTLAVGTGSFHFLKETYLLIADPDFAGGGLIQYPDQI